MSENNSALARIESPTDFGPEHMVIVREAFAPGASEAEFAVMWAGAKARGLDPVRKQIHFVCRYDNQKGRDVWSSQVSIDGFRAIAEATGKYDGQDEPEYEYDEQGRLLIARVRVWRKDITRPFVGVARWTEYVQTKKGGEPSHMWAKMEHTMLGKCAEALGLRKAFPEPLAGLYTGDEMAQASNEEQPRRGNKATVQDADFEPTDRNARPSPTPKAPHVDAAPLDTDKSPRAAGFRARANKATPEDIVILLAHDAPAARADGWACAIRNAPAAELAAIEGQLREREQHEAVREDMLAMAEKRRASMLAEVPS